VDVDLIGWVGVGLGRTYGCRCGILYAPMLGVVFYAGLVSLTSFSYPSPCSPYSSELRNYELLVTFEFNSKQIYNLEETGMTTVPSKLSHNQHHN